MGIGIGRFLSWKNVFKATGTGIWSPGIGTKCQKSKGWVGNGIGTPPPPLPHLHALLQDPPIELN